MKILISKLYFWSRNISIFKKNELNKQISKWNNSQLQKPSDISPTHFWYRSSNLFQWNGIYLEIVFQKNSNNCEIIKILDDDEDDKSGQTLWTLQSIRATWL